MSPRSTLWLAGCVACLNLASWLAPGFAKGFESPWVAQQPGRAIAPQGKQLPMSVARERSQPSEIYLASNNTAPLSTVLKLGDRSPQVKALQTLLQQMGYEIQPDGVFGVQTQQAVIDFQQRVGLAANGQVDAATWQSLQSAQTDISSLLPSSPSPSPAVAVEEPEPSPEDRPDPPEPGFLSREGWMIGGAAIALLGGVVGYRLRQSRSIKRPPRRSPAPTATFDHRESVPFDALPTDAIPVTDAEPVASDRHPDAHQIESGSVSVTADGMNGKGKRADTNHGASSGSPEMTRLAKIDITDELIRDLQNPDTTRRRKAIWELGQRGESKALQPLLDLMINSDSHQQSLILTAISEIGMRALRPMNRALLNSLQHESADVRKNAIRDVTRIYDQMAQLSQLLHHAMDDSDSEVRETAHWALGQLNRVRGGQEGHISSSMPRLEDGSSSHIPPQIKADEHP